MTTEVKKEFDELTTAFEQFKKADTAAKTAMEKQFAANLDKRVGEIEDAIDAKLAAKNRSELTDEFNEKAQRSAALRSLKSYAQKGNTGYFAEALEEKAGYDITTDANGKFGVPTIIDAIVAKQVREYSPLRSLITIKTVGQTAYNGLLNHNNATSRSVAELGERTATNANTFARITINTHEQHANPGVSLQMLEDVGFDAESELLWSVGESFAAKESADWVNGTGDGDFMSKGFTTYTKADITAGALGDYDKFNTIDGSGDLIIKAEDVMNLQDALPEVFAKSGVFAMSRKTRNSIRKLKDENDNYLWQPSFMAGVPSTLAGSPVVIVPELSSAVTANATPIVFADWKNFYYGVDRIGLSVLRDPYSVEGSVVFKFRKRLGGGLFNGRAGVGLKMKDLA